MTGNFNSENTISDFFTNFYVSLVSSLQLC